MFTPHVKENLRLEPVLVDLARPARENVARLPPAQLEAATDHDLMELLVEDWSRATAPLVVGELRAPTEPARTERRARDRDDPVDRHYVWRWAVGFELAGDSDLLCRWPDRLHAEPCGENLNLVPLPWVYWERHGHTAIAYFDVLCDDDPEGTAQPTDRILEAGAYLRAAVETTNDEVAAYDTALRAELRDQIVARRERLGAIAEQRIELIELARDHFAPIEVQPAVDADAAPRASLAVGGDIVVNQVISDGSFADLLTVTRKWARGAERYPAAYGSLEEEPITSLLVTTLNVVFDVAHREVFHSSGKTDIFVQANLDRPDEVAHIGEAKIWGGKQQVLGTEAAVGDVAQALGYANARTKELMLVYYVRQQKLGLIQDRAVAAVAGCDGFCRWEGEGDERRAVFIHPDYGNEIGVALTFVHLPMEGTADPDGEVVP